MLMSSSRFLLRYRKRLQYPQRWIHSTSSTLPKNPNRLWTIYTSICIGTTASGFAVGITNSSTDEPFAKFFMDSVGYASIGLWVGIASPILIPMVIGLGGIYQAKKCLKSPRVDHSDPDVEP